MVLSFKKRRVALIEREESASTSVERSQLLPVLSLRKVEESEQGISIPTFKFVYLEGSEALHVAAWNLEAGHRTAAKENQATKDLICRAQEAFSSLGQGPSIAKQMLTLRAIETESLSLSLSPFTN